MIFPKPPAHLSPVGWSHPRSPDHADGLRVHGLAVVFLFWFRISDPPATSGQPFTGVGTRVGATHPGGAPLSMNSTYHKAYVWRPVYVSADEVLNDRS